MRFGATFRRTVSLQTEGTPLAFRVPAPAVRCTVCRAPRDTAPGPARREELPEAALRTRPQRTAAGPTQGCPAGRGGAAAHGGAEA